MTSDLPKRLASIPWWLVLLQGCLSILLGILLFMAPGAALMILVRLLGWYWLIKGIFSLVAIFHPDAASHRGWLIVNALLGIFAGIAVLDHPVLSTVFVPAVVVTIMGVVGIIIGVNDLAAAFRGGGFGIALLGVLSVIAGIALLSNTLIGVALLPYLIGGAELAGGVGALFLAFKLRSLHAR